MNQLKIALVAAIAILAGICIEAARGCQHPGSVQWR
jgi:hypothetical protein